MNKNFISLLIISLLFILFFSNCAAPYSKEEYMKLGQNDSPSVTTVVNITGTRNASIIIASSDSQPSSQSGADIVISISDDAGLTINSQISKLNSSTGGSILLMEGTYNISTNILPLSNVNIIGQGSGTILRRNSNSLVQIIYVASTVSNVTFKDFYIDGNGTNFTITGDCYGINSQVTTNTGISYYNIQSNNINCTNQGIGFKNCNYLTICISNNNNGNNNGSVGFHSCSNLTNCIANNNTGSNSVGFFSCNSLSKCVASSNNGSNGNGIGFSGCNYLTNCTGNNNTSSSNSNGVGFWGCIYLTNCNGYFNSSSSGYGYGFILCNRMQQNTGIGNTTALFNNCYSDNGSTPVAMTGDGGWNG
jgi:hypothetical protein